MSTKTVKPQEFVRWTVEVGVDRIWVEDGFNLSLDEFEKAMKAVLPYAYAKEVQVKIVKAPPPALIKAMQK